MLIETDSDLFDTGSFRIAEVMTIIQLFASGTHEWAANARDIDAIERCLNDHIPKHAGEVCSLARKSFSARAAYSQSTRRTFKVRQSNISVAISDLQRPGVIVCEDIVSDVGFLKAIAQVFDRPNLVSAFDSRRIQFANGGGARIVEVAKSELTNFRLVSRVFVLMDSDALIPGQVTAHHQQSASLQEAGAATHVLKRREVENYIPLRAIHSGGPSHTRFRRRPELHKAIAAVKVLNEEQYSHFDFKKGFKSTPHAPTENMHASQTALYADVPSEVLREISQGFGDKILGCVAACAGILTPEDFAKLGASVRHELEEILDKIEMQL